MITLTNMDRSSIQLFEEEIGKTFENQAALEQHLTERFNEINDLSDDTQASFNELNRELGGLLELYFCYSISEIGEIWSVQPGESFDMARLPEYLALFTETYITNHATLEDMISTLEYRVSKDMQNAGVDAKNALRMILEDDLYEPGLFFIDGAYATPRILYLD